MNIQDTEIGTKIESNRFVILFGNRNANIQAVQTEFPDVKMKRIKQVHGNQIIHTNTHAIDFSREADAHYTGEKNLGLCIATADCIPVVLYHEKPEWIACIHAGWRGVQNQIVPKTIQQMQRLGCKPGSLLVFIGPHIMAPSFEVGNDVRDALLKSSPQPDSSMWTSSTEGKSKVDLLAILKAQLIHSGIDLHRSHLEVRDTFADQNYHSFRRDKESAGRQLSLVYLKT